MFDMLSDKFHDAFQNIRGKGKISEANIEDTLKQVKALYSPREESAYYSRGQSNYKWKAEPG